MTLSLRTLLLGLTMVAIVAVTLVEQILVFKQRVRDAQEQTAAQTRLLTSAGAPLLVNSLVVGDLATVEQTLRNINRDFAWREVKLYEADGRRLIIDVTPAIVVESSAPAWFRRLLPPPPGETRIQLKADPVVYAVLAVTPSSRNLENALWQGLSYSVVVTAVLLLVFVALVNVILVRGLRPVQALGTSAARLGAGDLSARMPAPRFREMAPTVLAFNAMAENLEQVMAELRTNEAALEQREAERKRAERGRAAQLAVSRILAEADAPEDGIARVLEAIGASLRWDWGEAWRVDADEGVLRSTASWPASGGAARTLSRGTGLAGRVWATGEPDWIEEVSAEWGALPEGTRTACAFPIRGGRGVLALMVFGSRDVRTADDGLLATMTSMGGQIGQYLERKEGEEALRRTEAQLHGMQKMEAIGQLAGGVAHDFNNLLTVIIGRSALLLDRLPEGDRARRDITLIHDTAHRAARLTRQLLAFGRKQVLQPKPLNLNTITEALTPMLRRLLGENIELGTHLAPGIGLVKADPSRVEQVIVNLAVNARDAMPRGGRLTLETADVDVDAAYVRRHPGARAGAHVRLSVSDTGTGMDRATMARIFEPFFSTKGASAGTGLGLATVYGIVKQSEGTIWVYSEPGQGTVFKIYLPTSTEAATPEEAEAGPARRARGTETILLTEDEEGVRELGRDILRTQGYTVLEAGDADEAMVVSEQHAGPIDLLLTDVVMPRASGRELAERLRPLRPRMKVLYMSGYTDRAIVHHGVLDPDVAFLEKPFTADDLARKVREVLDK